MENEFLFHFHEIQNEDQRFVIQTLLIDILNSLIDNHFNDQYRILPFKFINEYFIEHQSAMNCLRSIGFQQIETGDYQFNENISQDILKEIRRILEIEQIELNSNSISEQIDENDFQRISFDQLKFNEKKIHNENSSLKQIPFLSKLKQVQSYEEKKLLEFISKKILPRKQFEDEIREKYSEEFLNKTDLLIIELLKWFKEDYFIWFDQPTCKQCQIKMIFLSFDQPNQFEIIFGHSSQVEIYRCSLCLNQYRFPRYNKIWMLLKTRRGRCGEAANLFTCFARSLSFQSRLIYDPSDHLWTEIYSEKRQQWIHCDPCENLFDSPLIYEQGWNKSIEFCIAFAKDHIEDVTWRYVQQFQLTIQRRNIDEHQFSYFIHSINKFILSKINANQRIFIIQRRIQDLINMLKQRKETKQSELHGRTSGSIQWRLDRNEINQQKEKIQGFIYQINDEDLKENLIYSIEYNSIEDNYYLNQRKEMNSHWIDRLYSFSNIQRKIEHDWKMVYLTRKSLFQQGILSWKFQMNFKEFVFLHRIQIQCSIHLFDQFSMVQSFLIDSNQQQIPIDFGLSFLVYRRNIKENFLFFSDSNHRYEKEFETNQSISFEKDLIFKLILTNSNDENDSNAWQKAQLFRQSIDSNSDHDQSHLFQIHLHFISFKSN